MRRWPAWLAAAMMGIVWLGGPTLGAQDTPSPTPTLTPVEVTVTREAARSPLDLPFAVSSTRPDSARPGQRHLALDETLLLLPGVTVANRYNPTQDPRISIRGFGARSAFGVRGVRILRDGMPLTLPDGQTPVDYLDLESVGTIEVIRGAASALYGNAAGGVVDIRSAPPPRDALAGQARHVNGSFGLQRWVGGLGGTRGRFGYQGTVTHTESDGFRDYAGHRATNGFGRVITVLGGTELQLQGMLFDMPLAENPGALTAAEMATNRERAQQLSVDRRARKEVSQGQFGLVASRPLGGGDLSAALFGGWRDLYNPLTFAIVGVDRQSYGASARASWPVRALGLAHRLTVGVDAQRQDDDRLNWENCNRPAGQTPPPALCPVAGSEKGNVRLDQRELVSSVGPYLRDELAFGGRYRVMLGARADFVRFEVEDRLVDAATANPDDGGVRTLRAFSPMVGAVARLGLLTSVYANYASAFETPTATELGNQPDGSAGINRELDPQYATTFEVGMKGFAFSLLRYDFSLFDTRVRDELIPFEIPGGAGRRYFRNAGRTARRGAEVGLATVLGPLELQTAYSYAHFEFDEYSVTTGGVTTVYDDKRIPGVPVQQFQASATYRLASTFATAELATQSNLFVDDANSSKAGGYELLHLRVGGTAAFGKPWLAPTLGVQNVFGRKYAAVSVNAAGGRYFEPAPGRTIFAGLTLAVGR
ncbi:MAG TPA: TonB-dependent receptor [Gemmatimonadaceae bacterium]|nr:TonB-dependent receptor [Gemmatimonadaceae bacterium]